MKSSIVAVAAALLTLAVPAAAGAAPIAPPKYAAPTGPANTNIPDAGPVVPGAGRPDPDLPPINVRGTLLPGGGVKVGDDRVAYEGGLVYLIVDAKPKATAARAGKPRAHTATASFPPCPYNVTCLYRDNNYSGSPNHFEAAGGGNFQLSAYGFNDVTSSWINNRSNTARLYEDWTSGAPSGSYLTLNPDSHSASLSASWNDVGSGLKII